MADDALLVTTATASLLPPFVPGSPAPAAAPDSGASSDPFAKLVADVMAGLDPSSSAAGLVAQLLGAQNIPVASVTPAGGALSPPPTDAGLANPNTDLLQGLPPLTATTSGAPGNDAQPSGNNLPLLQSALLQSATPPNPALPAVAATSAARVDTVQIPEAALLGGAAAALTSADPQLPPSTVSASASALDLTGAAASASIPASAFAELLGSARRDALAGKSSNTLTALPTVQTAGGPNADASRSAPIAVTTPGPSLYALLTGSAAKGSDDTTFMTALASASERDGATPQNTNTTPQGAPALLNDSNFVLTPPTPVARAVESHLPLPLRDPNWAGAFADHVTYLVKGDMNQAELHLNPPELGRIDVRIALTQDQASLVFSSPQAGVRDVIESSLPRLREMLNDSGIALVNVDISDRSLTQDRRNQPSPSSESNSPSYNGSGSGNDSEDAVVAELTARILPRAQGFVDYYV